VKSQKD